MAYDKHQDEELDALAAHLAEIRKIAAEEEAALAKLNSKASKDLVKDKQVLSASKKKATTTKKKKKPLIE